MDTLDGLVPQETAVDLKTEEEASQVEGTMTGDLGVTLIPLSVPTGAQLDRQALLSLRRLVDAASAAQVMDSQAHGRQVEQLSRLLDAVIGAGDRVPHGLRRKLESFARRFFARRAAGLPPECSLPGFIPGELAAAAQHAVQAGEDPGLDAMDGLAPGTPRLEKLEALLASVRPLVFDCDQPATAPQETLAADTGRSREALAASLETAAEGLSPSTAVYLQEAATALRAGAPAEGTMASWARAEGPVEVYLSWGEARGAGDLCLVVALRDEARTQAAKALTDRAEEWEKDMPWLERLKRRGPPVLARRVVVANAVAGYCPSLSESGGVLVWPRHPAVDALPGKVLQLDNVAAALNDAGGAERTCARLARVVLGEAIAAPSGKPSHLVRGSPADLLGDLQPFVEDLRRTLITLYLSMDPRVAKSTLFSVPGCIAALFDDLLTAPIGPACQARAPAHDPLARSIIRGRLESAGALGQASEDDPDSTRRVVDQSKARPVIASLLGEVQRMASAGDKIAATRLRDEALRGRAAAKAQGGGLPCALLMPTIELEKGPDGALVGLALSETSDILFPRRKAAANPGLGGAQQ